MLEPRNSSNVPNHLQLHYLRAQMDPFPLHQSLLDHTTTAATTYGVHALTSFPQKSVNSNVSDIFFRVILISLFATVAIWANHEASKGFSITIVNDAGKHSFAGKRFSIFYESNDRATRTLLNTSRFVETLLYPNQDSQHKKKQIKTVTLKLAAKTFPAIVSVHSEKPHEYTITLSPSLMQTTSHKSFVLAVLKGMARVWIYDGKGAAPAAVLNGIVEYITTLAGFKNFGGGATVSPENDGICWKDEDSIKVAGFLRFYDERIRPGGGGGEVVRRLNDGMRNGWHDGVMDDALGMAGQHACASFDMLTRHPHPSSSM